MPVGTTIGKSVASDTARSRSARRPTPTGVHSTSAVTPSALDPLDLGNHQRDHVGGVGLGVAGRVGGAEIDEDVLVGKDHAELVGPLRSEGGDQFRHGDDPADLSASARASRLAVDIAAGQDDGDRLAARVEPARQERGEGDGAAGLDHQLQLMEGKGDRGKRFGVADRDGAASCRHC